jgi:hypothetical protein
MDDNLDCAPKKKVEIIFLREISFQVSNQPAEVSGRI